MRDKRFIAEHRGGPLKKEQHRQLIKWAYECAEHLLPLLKDKIDERLINAIKVAKEWEKGKVKTGIAMKASRDAHAAARDYSDQTSIAVARAIGHAVATAHMADHSLGPILYGLKAIKNAGKSVEKEREWQINKIPTEVKELVLSALSKKESKFKI
jgi:hypothetical protein